MSEFGILSLFQEEKENQNNAKKGKLEEKVQEISPGTPGVGATGPSPICAPKAISSEKNEDIETGKNFAENTNIFIYILFLDTCVYALCT